MRIANISIKWKLISMCVILVTIPVVTLGVWIYHSSKMEIYRSTEDKLREQVFMIKSHLETGMKTSREKVNSDLNVARHIFSSYGQAILDDEEQIRFEAVDQSTKNMGSITIPTMKIQGQATPLSYERNYVVPLKYEIVDTIQQLVDGTATIFQVIPEGLLRISTNVLQADGSRAVGTYLPKDSPVYQSIMRGEVFYSRTHIANAWYQTAYAPLKDAEGAIIGALHVGAEDASEPIMDSLAEMVVGKTGYVWILNLRGEYMLSYQRQRDGDNMTGTKDETGRFFVKEWLEVAPTLQEGETRVEYYPFQSRLKIAAYIYFEEWEWIIGSSTYIDDFLDQVTHIRKIAIGVSLAAILLGSVAAYVFVLALVKKFKHLVFQMSEVAHGNLTIDIQVDRGDEIGMLNRALQNMVSNLRQQTSDIAEGVNVLASSAGEISASVSQFASNSAETSTSVGETTATIEEVRHTAELANQKAQQVSSSAQNAVQISQGGRKATENTVNGMNHIREQMTSIADSIVKLSEQSQAIGSIIATVGDLADQSNLLAVNASIEATKAGEQGKGFTVVAQEIRSLAEQSKQATMQVQTILNNIQKATSAAVMATEQGTKAVEAGAKQAVEAGGSIQTLADSIMEAAQAMSQIAVSSQEQTVGMNQIAEAMGSIQQAGMQNVDSSNQLEISARNLQELGHTLKQQVDKYTV